MKNLKWLILLLCCASCSPQYQSYTREFPSPQTVITEKPIIEKKVNIALVLGSGGARGMAHVGVLEELEKAGIPIDMIVGTSAGSLVGAFYAKTPSSKVVKSELHGVKFKDFAVFKLFSRSSSLYCANGFKQFLLRKFSSMQFNDLSIPLVAVATDLGNGELAVFDQGPVAPAVHASSAIPFYFSPVRYDGRVFVDGAVLSPLPVQVARQYEPNIVIAVDISSALSRSLPTNLVAVASRCSKIRSICVYQKSGAEADILIDPQVSHIGTFDENHQEVLYERGREAARKMMPKILALIEEKRNS